MKVLHINKSDAGGGAPIAAYRLHEGLIKQGIDSKLLVGTAKTKSSRVTSIESETWLGKRLYRFTHQAGLNGLNFVSTFKIPENSFYKDADILNFHILHTGYFNYLAIPKLTQQKPAIFTLHDMWSFTGHCVYSFDCDRWKIGCGKCPYPDSYPEIVKDNTWIEWKLKDWVYKHSNLQIVTLSTWLTEQVKQSMLNRFPIHHIPNGIDTDTYQPLDKKSCRAALGIPLNKKVLMCGAVSLSDPRKGGNLLISALQKLPANLRAEIVLLLMGDGGEGIAEMAGIEVLQLGYISSDRLKAVAYSAADVFVFSSRADNLPLVLQESMACGTPMVAFKIGGVPDLVRPDITGYLADPEDPKDLCQGIMQLLEDTQLRESMKQQSRKIAIEEYSLKLQSQRYIQLYDQVLCN